MTKSDLFPGLDDISFADTDPVKIERDIITLYETMTGRSLAKGDPVRLFLDTIAAVFVQLYSTLDTSAKLNLLAYSEGAFLDHLGALLDVTRLEAARAETTLRFSLSEGQPAAVIIPAGTRVSPGGGTLLFATEEAVEIPAGETEIDVVAQCSEAGEVGNGFVPGQLKKLVDPFPYEMSVSNVTTSGGGADTEGDENLRERIQIAPESFSVAGPDGAYEYYARSAHQGIINVAVLGPEDSTAAHVITPGNVEVYPLMVGGELPSREILDAVSAALNAKDKRPLTDYVHVLTPEAVNYNISVSYWIERSNAARGASIQAAVTAAVQEWVTWQRSRLGRDINPSELTRRMVAAGAKRVEIASPSFTVLTATQVAIPGGVSVLYGGLEDG